MSARPPRLDADDREQARIVQQILQRRLGYVPEWNPGERTPGAALARIAARYLATVLRRLNQAPEKNRLAFFDTLGVRLIPAQASRAPIVFQMAEGAAAGRIGSGAAVAAQPPEGETDPILFETEQAIGAIAGNLAQVVSLWPGRDAFIDHSEAHAASEPFRLFSKKDLQLVDHEIYIAHETLLALTGAVNLSLRIDLRQPSSEHLRVRWQFWNGDVWRDFLDLNAACQSDRSPKLDGTDGLRSSGRIQLIADCAEAQRREVNGVDGYWIRGKLEEPLPPNPQHKLPVIDSIRIGSTTARPLRSRLEAVEGPQNGQSDAPAVRLLNTAAHPIPGAAVVAEDASGPVTLTPRQPLESGVYESASLDLTAEYSFRVTLDGETASSAQPTRLSPGRFLDLTLDVTGLAADAAAAGAEELDVSKPFFPFGLQPAPGSTFYFRNDEVLSKPGAAVRLYLPTTRTPLDDVSAHAISPSPIERAVVSQQPQISRLEHVVSWEYWNSRRWVPFLRSGESRPEKDFTQTEIVDFTVPLDIARTEVNGEEAHWLRARLLRGGYGFRATVRWLQGSGGGSNTFTYVVQQPPSLADLRIGYAWQFGPEHPDRTFTHNDFRFEDNSDEARWPGQGFQPFRRVEDITPAMFLGFDRKPPVDRLSFYFDIEEEAAEAGPPLRWEYFDGSAWRYVRAEDETARLRAPGMVSMLGPNEMRSSPRFGKPLYWLRARLKEDGPPGEATVRGLFPNAVWASQRSTHRNLALGASNATPGQTFDVAERPVLEGETIDVRELTGPRANTEWRLLALELNGADARLIARLEERLRAEGVGDEVAEGKLRLKRDANKRVTEVWVRWERREHLFFSGPEDRHYAVNRAQGRIFFGDGETGKIPPAGATILARELASGGGSKGNLPKGAIDRLVAEVAGVEAVFNARSAQGGADGESLEQYASRAPRALRHRGRAITARDYETMAREASPAVGFVRAVPTRNAAGRPAPGWITLLVIPTSDEPRPMPSRGLRRLIRDSISARAPGDLADCGHIHVAGPDYFGVDIAATVTPLASFAPGHVEANVRTALARFLHPLQGGPQGCGWDLGRDVYLSDVAAVVEQVEGVDYAEEIALFRDGAPAGQRVAIAADRMAVAGTISLRLLGEDE